MTHGRFRDMNDRIYRRPLAVESEMFTLAHLSDPHLGSLPLPTLSQLMSKRCLGYLSWQLRRRPVHEGPVLPALVDDLRARGPDHIAVTGDITNISLPAEFVHSARWLGELGPPADVTVIPGNHDAYVAVAWQQSWALWEANMSGVSADLAGPERPVKSAADFPFVRLRGSVALVGVSTARPMPPHSAAGRVGETQLALMGERLTALGREGVFRVVLIHHPPLPGGASPRKQLIDGAAFRAVIERTGAELVLFGHTHVSGLGKLATPNGHAPAIGVPSASARPHRGKDHARYHLYGIEAAGDDWRLEVEVRGVAAALDRFVPEGRFTLTVPRHRNGAGR